MEKIKIDFDMLALEPDKVKKLNDAGVDTSGCGFYWTCINIGNHQYYSLERKDIFPFDLEKDEYDAPTYLELRSILPVCIHINDKHYFLTELTDVSGTSMMYCEEHIGDILHQEMNYNPNTMIFNMIIWVIENGYMKKDNKDGE